MRSLLEKDGEFLMRMLHAVVLNEGDRTVTTFARIFFATEFTRHLDRSGYIRFRRWRFYAEAGLAKQKVQVSFYTSTLKIEYEETELAFYTLEWEDNKHIKEVKNPRVIETGY